VEPAYCDDPDAEFNRQWAQESIARAIETLRARFAAKGKGEFFEALKGSLTGEEPPRSESAERLGMTEDAVKVAVHRLRKDFRELLRREIAETVADSSDIDDELRHLVDALRR
jgi:RNA polymerase sigma-70 factor (ECF subfamily)